MTNPTVLSAEPGGHKFACIDGRVHLGTTPSPVGLIGRTKECRALDELLDVVRGGQSRVLVVQGDAGIGKSALLQHLVDAASGFRVIHATGVESEMELPFAALHQLCGSMLGRLDSLPDPQRDAANLRALVVVPGERRVRAHRGKITRPTADRAGGVGPVVVRCRGWRAVVCCRRCAVARSRVDASPHFRGEALVG